MFIARRPFRNVGDMITAGSIVEPADIRRFTYQLRFGNIIEINDVDLPKWAAFFRDRYGVDIMAGIAEKEQPTVAKDEPVVPQVEEAPVATKKPRARTRASAATVKTTEKKK